MMLALAIGVGSGCHSTDSGSEVTTPNAGSGGMDAGTSLNLGDAQADASSAGQAGASTDSGACAELAG